MKTKTHNRIAKIILPNLNSRTIERINRKMDRPEAWVPISPEFTKVRGVSYKAHRKRGHDPLSAMLIGFKEGGKEGAVAALLHSGADAARDQIVKKHGEDVADIIESVGNLCYKAYKANEKERRTKRNRQGPQSIGDSSRARRKGRKVRK